MEPTRRAVLAGALGVLAFPGRAPAAAPAPHGGTLDATVRRGSPGAGGYSRLVAGPGEPHVVREDLGTKAQAGRAGRRTSLVSFAQLTDIHLVDAQSPARVEYLDRYNDGPTSSLVFAAAYRPHEMLTTQVADRIVAAVEELGHGPVGRRPLDFVICTGDNNDNCQKNELRWQIDLLDGKQVRADSGDTTTWEGVHDQDATSYDVHYWHPDGTPSGKVDDVLRSQYGFPVVKGLLDAARRPFTAHGVKRRWYTCYGNHDGLVQGNFPVAFQLGSVATGPVKITSLPAGISPADVAAGDPSVLPALAAAPVRMVTADPERKVLTRTETVAEHFTTGGIPLGHGYTSQNVAEGTAHYTFPMAPHVLGVVMDTCNPNGYNNGSLDQAQFTWLQQVLAAATGTYVVVFSHHTSGSMDNPLVFADDPQPRVLGDQVTALLLATPNVVAWVNGHTHVNSVTAHARAGGGGFWEVNTASHVDWPAQARVLELLDNHDGTLSLFGTVIDAAAPLANGGRLDSTASLAALARELAANDPQERSDTRRGKVEDRNVELLVKAPFRLAAPPSKPVAQPEQPPGPTLPTTGLGDAAWLAAGTLGAALLARRLRSEDEA